MKTNSLFHIHFIKNEFIARAKALDERKSIRLAIFPHFKHLNMNAAQRRQRKRQEKTYTNVQTHTHILCREHFNITDVGFFRGVSA